MFKKWQIHQWVLLVIHCYNHETQAFQQRDINMIVGFLILIQLTSLAMGCGPESFARGGPILTSFFF